MSNVFDMESMSNTHIVSQQHLTWKFHVQVVQNDLTWSSMSNLYEKLHVTHVKCVLDIFDMESPCQFFLGVRTCTSDKKKAKAKSESKSKKLQAKQKRQAKAISKKQKAKAIAQIKSKKQT